MLHRKPCFIENLDFYNFDSFFDMTEKGQIKGVEGRKIEVNFHYMAVLGHIILETTYFNESETFYMAENGHIKGG